MLKDAKSGCAADFLRWIDINAGGFQLKKGQAILHPTTKSQATQKGAGIHGS